MYLCTLVYYIYCSDVLFRLYTYLNVTVTITTTTAPIHWLLFQDSLSKPIPERQTGLDLNEARGDWVLGCSGISSSVPRCRQITTPNTSSLTFYGPDAVSDAHQPRVSKHCRHSEHSIISIPSPSLFSSALTTQIPRTVYRHLLANLFFLLFSFCVFHFLGVSSVW